MAELAFCKLNLWTGFGPMEESRESHSSEEIAKKDSGISFESSLVTASVENRGLLEDV